jgi:hypothetical protein
MKPGMTRLATSVVVAAMLAILCAAMAAPSSVLIGGVPVSLVDWQTFSNSACSDEGTCIDAASGTCYGKSDVVVENGKIYEESSCATAPDGANIKTKRVESAD